MGLNILHLFAMIKNDSMAFTMVGSNEQYWITYDRIASLVARRK